jgi:hypothetical protein
MCPTAAQLSAASGLTGLKELSFVGQLHSSFPRHAISCLTQITSLRCDGRVADYNKAQLVSAVAQLTQLRALLLSQAGWHNELQQLTALTRLRLESIDGMQLPASIRELELSVYPDAGSLFTSLTALPISELRHLAPSLLRLSCTTVDGLVMPLKLDIPYRTGPPALQACLGPEGVLRLCNSLSLNFPSIPALAALQQGWMPGGSAAPAVMELVLPRGLSRQLLSYLPAGLTHLHLRGQLEMDSLLPVAKGLPRLRMMHLYLSCNNAGDVTSCTALLLHFLMAAEQRDSLTVVVETPEPGSDSDSDQPDLNEDLRLILCDKVVRLAAESIAPLRTPALVWLDEGPDDVYGCREGQ